MGDRRSVVDAIEGFHLAAVVHGLDRLGVFDEMTTPAAPVDIAEATRVDPGTLHVCLDYLAGRTDLVERSGDRYAVTAEWDDHARACVRQYIGAYGRPSLELAAVLREPGVGRDLIDRRAQARSYGVAPTVAHLVADLVLQLDLAPTLDLGCGSGSLLAELGRRRPDLAGWGVDGSEAMCAAAQARLAADGLAERITVVHGDAFDPGGLTGLARLAGEARSITAMSLLNELWDQRDGRPSVAAWLRTLAEAFPGRPLVVADYFGRVGRTPPPWPPQAAVHDLVQALSGQGVPPPDHDTWRTAYEAAGARLLHMVEDDDSSFFIHLVRLPGTA